MLFLDYIRSYHLQYSFLHLIYDLLGATDSLPIFDSGELPGAPFFQRFTPDDEGLVMLCYSPANETGEPYTALVMMEWGKLWIYIFIYI
jgi:hypothetical protein